MSELLTAKGVKKNYQSGSRILEVLRGVHLVIKRGEAVAIVGASGVGKSTLLHLLGALDRPTAGNISLDEVDYASVSDATLARIRNQRIGFIYQFHHLLPEFSALENVMVPGMIEGAGHIEPFRRFISFCWGVIHPTSRSAIFSGLHRRAEGLLREVGLGERLWHRPPKLSGGEQQRVALARALINDPDIVLADEPTGNLDLPTGEKMLNLIMEYTVGRRKALVLVTHNPDIAARADTIYHLKDGVLKKARL